MVPIINLASWLQTCLQIVSISHLLTTRLQQNYILWTCVHSDGIPPNCIPYWRSRPHNGLTWLAHLLYNKFKYKICLLVFKLRYLITWNTTGKLLLALMCLCCQIWKFLTKYAAIKIIFCLVSRSHLVICVIHHLKQCFPTWDPQKC
jgi:hypothetical protein